MQEEIKIEEEEEEYIPNSLDLLMVEILEELIIKKQCLSITKSHA